MLLLSNSLADSVEPHVGMDWLPRRRTPNLCLISTSSRHVPIDARNGLSTEAVSLPTVDLLALSYFGQLGAPITAYTAHHHLPFSLYLALQYGV